MTLLPLAETANAIAFVEEQRQKEAEFIKEALSIGSAWKQGKKEISGHIYAYDSGTSSHVQLCQTTSAGGVMETTFLVTHVPYCIGPGFDLIAGRKHCRATALWPLTLIVYSQPLKRNLELCASFDVFASSLGI
ncbi:hypothetical protein B0H14DRAFT_2629947 [Mycena olivaceomarginata]|nr:hypothetical protein B0H14DRAFT_2629947 [Mycena olivaceomarginata]